MLRGLLGLGADELKMLEAEGVVGQWADKPGQRPPDGWDGAGRAL